VSADRANQRGWGKPEDVPQCWRRGGAHRGNGRGRNSTAAIEQAVDHGELHDARTEREREREGEGARLGA
jgi:hypothetical protein